MRAKYFDCGAGQLPLWSAAAPAYNVPVDVNTAPFDMARICAGIGTGGRGLEPLLLLRSSHAKCFT